MRVNYHCHSRYCRHASGEVEDYVKAAIQKDVKILGCSDHSPFPGGFHGNGMDFEELDSYLSDVEDCSKKYSDKLKIYKALEIEYLPFIEKDFGFYSSLKNETLDYLLLGEHFYFDRNGKFQNIYLIEDVSLVEDYALNCKQAMDSGFFKIIAHPDIFTMPEFKWGDLQEKASDIIIEAAVKNNVILEFNANGLRRGVKAYEDGQRYQYPHVKFWEKVKTSNAKVVVGSDCHDPSQMWDDKMDQAYEYLKNQGIIPLEEIF